MAEPVLPLSHQQRVDDNCRKYGWSRTPACRLDLDGYCFTHRTWNMAECANAEMNTPRYPGDAEAQEGAQ